MGDSTKGRKPEKPYPEFPLFAHASGRWAKKIRGKLVYFGKWDDWQSALEKYQSERDDLHAGREPRANRDAATIRDLCNRFLTHKKALFENQELTARSYGDYHRTCDLIIDYFGKGRHVEDLRADDFAAFRDALATSRNATTLGNDINRVRGVFKYAFDCELIEKPVRFGPGFNRPSKKAIRLTRQKKQAEHGKRMFEANELRTAIDNANQSFRAMILLAMNCGLGQTDIAAMPRTAIDLKTGWLDFPRPKTAVERRCPLWPETIKATREALSKMPSPKRREDSQLVFITKYGGRWVREYVRPETNRTAIVDSIGLEFSKLLRELGIKRHGVSFYAIRHTFQTIGSEAKDPEAVSHIMGHADASMAAVYRESISNERLKAVTDHVRAWLFPNNRKGRNS